MKASIAADNPVTQFINNILPETASKLEGTAFETLANQTRRRASIGSREAARLAG
jgi:hypothetical protein